MDLNDLKKINDDFGHDAGDKALKTVVKCMDASFSNIGVVYRTGGDEFMAIFPEKNISKVDAAVEDFRNRLSQTIYVVALGIAVYNPGDDFEEVIKKSDSYMYEDKKLLKKGREIR